MRHVKHKVAKSVLATVLSVCMVGLLVPASAITAFADSGKADDQSDVKLVEASKISVKAMEALVSDELAAAPLNMLSAKAASAEEDLPSEADGSKIEQISVEWVTSDTKDDGDDSRLSLVPGDDNAFSVVMRLNMAFSGQYDYEAGDIQLTIPKSLFANRTGSSTGTMTLSVPEAPDSRATFSYTDMGDYYLLSNTRKLSAATSAMFEFSISGLKPHTIIDGVESDNAEGDTTAYTTSAFQGTVNVTTHAGNTIAKSSNEIDCIIDTAEKVTNAFKSANSISEQWPSSWPSSLKPDNADEYIYVDWKTYSYIKGNQTFDMSVMDNAKTNQAPDAVLLGYKDSASGTLYKGTQSDTMSKDIYANGYKVDGAQFAGIWYVAYPKADFENGNVYTLTNKVTYTLTDTDDQTVSTASATGKITYAPVAYDEPDGYFDIDKYGDGNVENYKDGDWEGIYGNALNQLLNGHDVDLSYEVDVTGFTMPWTVDGDTASADSYNKKDVKMVVTDDETHYNFNTADLTSDDFEFKSLRIAKPTMATYKKFAETATGYTGKSKSSTKIPGGSYGYALNTDPSLIPAIEVYGKTETGEWVHYATVDWSSGKAASTPYNGASCSGSTVTFPQGVTDYKTELTTNRDGIFYDMYPTMTLKATDAIISQTRSLFTDEDTPTTKTSNKVTLTVFDSDDNLIATDSAVGRDDLESVALAVRQNKSATYESDAASSLVTIHYTSHVYEQSNLTDLDVYNEAIDTGALLPETQGTYYDLLPEGVVPDLDSIELRSGDTITGVKAVENYKGSNRTLLVVNAKLTPSLTSKYQATGNLTGYCDTLTISFDATYTWAAMKDYGTKLDNVISFESSNSQLGTLSKYKGEPDRPTAGNNIYSADAVKGVESYMTNLDSTRDTNSFVYARCDTSLDLVTSAVNSLSKRVSVNGDGYYDTGLSNDYPMNVYEGGNYTYRLRMKNSDDTASKDIVIYDNLENYVPTSDKSDYGDIQWRGTFSRIDVSQIANKGIDVKVYYSTKSGLVLDNTDDRSDMDLTDTSIWSTTCPTDKSTITAIAVDASKDTDGNTYELKVGDSLVAYVHMIAPKVRNLAEEGQEAQWYDADLATGETEAGLTGGAHAYNNVSMLATMIGASGSISEHQLIRNDYVKVGLIPYSIVTKKIWNDKGDQDGKRLDTVTVHLYANGVDTGKKVELSDDNKWTANWTATFDDILPVDENGNKIAYTFVEDDIEGYSASTTKSISGDDQLYTITNTHTPEKIALSGTKTWDDGEDAAGKRPESVVINLYADGVYKSSTTVKPDADGNWTYSFSNLDKYKKGKEIAYTVEEEYVNGYVTTYEDDGDITNTYSPYGDLKIAKTVEGATNAASDKVFTFTVSIAGEDGQLDANEYTYTTSSGTTGKVSSGGTIKLKDGESATIKDIPSESTYSVEEEDVDGFTISSSSGLTGAIRAGETSKATITNTYSSEGSAQLTATKTLTGRTLTAKQFSFQVLDEEGTLLRSASCAADGSVTFGLLKYTAADDGKTYNYTIREKVPDDAVNGDGVAYADATAAQKAAGGFTKKGYSYDSSEYDATVLVNDNGDGTMKTTITYEDGEADFTNAYHASGDVTLNLWKTLKARDLKANEFSFGLYEEDGTIPVTDEDGNAITAKNAADGTVTFPALSYDEGDVDKTYTYVAKEIVPDESDADYDPTVVYDTTPWTYQVKVYDNGDGTLSFDQKTIDADGNEGTLPVVANTLKDGSLTIMKSVQSGDANKEFKFKVKLTSPTGDDLDGEYNFTRKQVTPQTVDITLTTTDGTALSGVTCTVYKKDSAGKLTSMGEYTSDDAGNINVQGLDELEDGSTYTATITSVPDGYAMPADTSISLSNTDTTWSATAEVEDDPGQAYAYFDSSTGKLTITRASKSYVAALPDTDGTITYYKQDLESYAYSSDDYVCWYGSKGSITSISIEQELKPQDMTAWFSGMTNLTTITGIEKIDTSQITGIGSLFENCSSLTELDLSTWDLRKVDNVYMAFYKCSSLVTIYASKNTVPESLSDTGFSTYQTFTNCTNLKGPYHSFSENSGIYARIDTADTIGYFTEKATGAKLSALSIADVLEDALEVLAQPFVQLFDANNAEEAVESVGADGTSAKAARKSMSAMSLTTQAADDIASGTCGTCDWVIDVNGKLTIKPSSGTEGTLDEISSTNDVPWYAYNTKITSAVVEGTVHTGTNANFLLRDCKNMTTADLAGLETSGTENMNAMFMNCNALTSLDLTNFDTSNVTTMVTMFYGCKDMTSLDVSSFNTSKVASLMNVFWNCSSLTTLDLSNFDTSKVTSMMNTFKGCSSLTFLDLSNWDTTKVSSMDYAFDGDTALVKVKLGANFSFKGSGTSAKATLPTPSGVKYTGNWQSEEDPSIVLSASALADAYPSAATAPVGTWTAELANGYAVVFKGNGGGGSMADLFYNLDEEYTLPENSFYYFSKKFTGWNTEANGTGTAYASGAIVKNMAGTGDTVTLYAQWEDEPSSGTITDGQMEVTVHGNEALTISGLPAGTQYQVYEETPSGWVLVQQRGQNGVIESLETAEASFVNDYQPGKVQATITGTKTLEGEAGTVSAGDYKFQLKDSSDTVLQTVACGDGGTIAFDPITYTTAGTYTYTVSEVTDGQPVYMNYDTHKETVTVTVTDDGEGNLSATTAYDTDGIAFNNLYNSMSPVVPPNKAELSIQKLLEGGGSLGTEFSFDVVTVTKGTSSTSTVKVKAGQTVSVGTFSAGTTYTITETDIPNGYTLTGTVGDSGTLVGGTSTTAVFTNTYSATGSFTPKAAKTLTGSTLESGQFIFALYDEGGNVVQKVANDSEGSIDFEPVTLTKEGTYHYTIKEVIPAEGDEDYDATMVYDDHEEGLTVLATDEGDGTLSTQVTYDADGATFENSLKPGSLTLSKSVTGGTSATEGKEFEFTVSLKDAQGNALTDVYNWTRSNGTASTVSNGGKIALCDDETVTISGLPAGATYELTESVPSGYAQQDTSGLAGTIEANKTAKATVTNSYATQGVWTPSASKVVSGSTLEKGQFSFVLTDDDGTLLQTATNDAAGKVNFQPVTYTGADNGKTYTYKISEVKGTEAGYKYDDHSVTVKVTVADNGDGTMKVNAVYGDGDNVFTNFFSMLLPKTGSRGYLIAIGIGILLILAGGLGLRRRKKQVPPVGKHLKSAA